jgi:phospholipase C
MAKQTFEKRSGPLSESRDSRAGKAIGNGQSLLPGIEHVVVLMFENRSFDNVLGGLYPGKSQSEYNGLTGTETNPDDACSSNPNQISVFQGPRDLDTMVMPYPDPGELFNDMNEQIFGCCTLDQYLANECPDTGPETMKGFVANYLRQPPSPDQLAPTANHIMQYYAPGNEGNIPITSALAQAYAVSDQWFCSGPVQTLANRFFVHCATPSSYLENGTCYALTDNTGLTDRHKDPDGSVTDKSVFELLDEAAASDEWPWPERLPWKVYYHDWPLAAFVKYVDDNWGVLFDGNVYHANDWFGGFFHDVKNDELPTYSFIEPCYTDVFLGTPSSNHPGGSDINENPPAISICPGEQLLQSIYTALYNGPNNLFEKTLFIVTYDEHGGLYDHAEPPAAVPPFAPGTVQGFDYDRYGVRVPAIFINPYIQPETIFRPQSGSTPFDHTSIISTLCSQFGLAGPLTPRDASAPTLMGLVDPQNALNPFSPDNLPSFTCPTSEAAPMAVGERRTEPRPESIAAAIKKAIRSPKNQMRVSRLSGPKL